MAKEHNTAPKLIAAPSPSKLTIKPKVMKKALPQPKIAP
jgi:hypothetical protein